MILCKLSRLTIFQGGYSPFLLAAMKNKVGAMEVLANCKGNVINDVTDVSKCYFYQIPWRH